MCNMVQRFLFWILFNNLDNLLESTVDGRARLDTLVKVDGGKGALADALGGDLEFLEAFVSMM
jgi:hypothetical protein